LFTNDANESADGDDAEAIDLIDAAPEVDGHDKGHCLIVKEYRAAVGDCGFCFVGTYFVDV
jgi:hypothetical protein